MKEVRSLKDKVAALEKDLAVLHRNKFVPRMNSCCHVYVKSKAAHIQESELPTYLSCPVLCAEKVGSAWKVKIPKDSLCKAICASSDVLHVQIWKNKQITSRNTHHSLSLPTPILCDTSPSRRGTVVVSITAFPTFSPSFVKVLISLF